jgi:hypothetical protein
MREQLPEKLSPFGRTRTGKLGGPLSLISPLQTSRSYETDLTKALDEIGYFPASARRASGESVEDFNARRKRDGAEEETFLRDLLSGGEWAWQFVSNDARSEFETTGDRAELVRSALRNYKSARTRERKSNRE